DGVGHDLEGAHGIAVKGAGLQDSAGIEVNGAYSVVAGAFRLKCEVAGVAAVEILLHNRVEMPLGLAAQGLSDVHVLSRDSQGHESPPAVVDGLQARPSQMGMAMRRV